MNTIIMYVMIDVRCVLQVSSDDPTSATQILDLSSGANLLPDFEEVSCTEFQILTAGLKLNMGTPSTTPR